MRGHGGHSTVGNSGIRMGRWRRRRRRGRSNRSSVVASFHW
jgi:hypothetical protein